MPHQISMELNLKNINHNSLELLIHIICWGLFFVFPIFFSQHDDGSIDWNDFVHHSVFPASMCITFYINYLLLVPHVLFKGHTGRFFLMNLITIIIIAVGVRYCNNISTPPPIHNSQIAPPPQFIFYLRDVISMMFCAGLSVAIRMSLRWSDAELARREAVKSRTEAELKNLRNQLNPHFLLNTLNNIYALTVFDTEKAQRAIQELSKLLRYVLYDNQQTFVPLNKEVEFIRNYIELMRIRFSSQVKINTCFDIRPNSQSLIAPLLFISLIENAFKHGISPTEPSFIDINISESGNTICCVIRNSNFPKNEKDKSGSGIGLEQVLKRLKLLYAGHYTWDKQLSDDGKEYTSSLTITIPQTKNIES